MSNIPSNTEPVFPLFTFPGSHFYDFGRDGYLAGEGPYAEQGRNRRKVAITLLPDHQKVEED